MPVSRRIPFACALFAAFTLAGCDSSEPAADESAATASPETTGPAQLVSRARIALATLVPGAQTARLANVRDGAYGAVCGGVAVAPGARPHPFIVMRDGSAIVSATPVVRIDDPADPFPDQYMRYCASLEELRGMEQQIDTLAPGANRADGIPPEPIADPDAPPGDEDQPTAPAPPEPPGSGDEDSFFNAVVRPPRD